MNWLYWWIGARWHKKRLSLMSWNTLFKKFVKMLCLKVVQVEQFDCIRCPKTMESIYVNKKIHICRVFHGAFLKKKRSVSRKIKEILMKNWDRHLSWPTRYFNVSNVSYSDRSADQKNQKVFGQSKKFSVMTEDWPKKNTDLERLSSTPTKTLKSSFSIAKR